MSTPPPSTTPPATPVTLSDDQVASLASQLATQLAQLLVARDPAPVAVGDPLGGGTSVTPPSGTVVTATPEFPQPAPAAGTSSTSTTSTTGATS
jgi:hypothetical protein